MRTFTLTGNTPCGISIPQVVDKATYITELHDFLKRADALGYESAWTQEGILGKFPLLEPLSLLSHAAALTTNLRLGVSIMLLTLRNPIQLAKTLVTIDQLSGGRLDVGVGAGGHVDEGIFGYSKERRMRRFTEEIAVMKALWGEDDASVSGTFWNFENLSMNPKPLQSPHPPIWFGARSEAGIRRAVRLGDAWMGAGSSSTSAFVKQMEVVRRELDTANRDPSTFRISKRVYIAIDDDRARAERRLREWFGLRYGNEDMAVRDSIWGSAAQCLDELAEVVEAGAEHLLLNPVFDAREHLDTLAEAVVPHL
jgi:probable F420-dependent oxidoreductase